MRYYSPFQKRWVYKLIARTYQNMFPNKYYWEYKLAKRAQIKLLYHGTKIMQTINHLFTVI